MLGPVDADDGRTTKMLTGPDESDLALIASLRRNPRATCSLVLSDSGALDDAAAIGVVVIGFTCDDDDEDEDDDDDSNTSNGCELFCG